MGISFSCPFADFDDLESYFEAILVRSIGLGGGDVRTELHSVSFNSRHREPTAMKSYGSGKMLLEGSLNFKGRALNTTFSFKNPPNSDVEKKVFVRSISLKTGKKGDHFTVPDSFTKKNVGEKHMKSDSFSKKTTSSPLPQSADRRHLAAVKLQKVYKSFRTRRQLADCAVVVEQKWWKLLDFAELKRSSISFFDIDKPESAFSRWSRARTKAAKLGKGLSKDSKARKLALQHWLEAIDPRHRYGHNLQFYYVKWLHCQSRQPFFYWLDIGEGKEVNLERCPRSKLQQQCIKYLGPTERQEYEVVVKNGKFFYKNSEKVLDTREGPKDTKWIFVLSTAKTLYVGKKTKGTFQHSSFLAGGATLSAGRLVIEDGILKAVWPHSGHYLPTEENFQEFMLFLMEHNIDVSKVQKSPDDGEEESFTLKSTVSSIRPNQSETDLSRYREATNVESLPRENVNLRQQDSNAVQSKLSLKLSSNITKLEIPTRYDVVNTFKREEVEPSYHTEPSSPVEDAEDGYASAEDTFLTEEDFMFPKYNLFDDDEEDDEEPIPEEKIIKRIDSHKTMKSYQLAKQLSSKWTTGAGPRIGCMRDYPSELQFRVLEHAHLSPRATSASSSPRTTSRFSPRVSSPKVSMAASQCRETSCSNRSPLAAGQVTDSSS